MSQVPPPDPGSPFELPIQTAPEWLRQPLRIANDREPWYYGFLEKYARVLLWAGVLTFLLTALFVLVPLLAPETGARVFRSVVTPLISQTTRLPGVAPDTGPIAFFAARIVIGMVVLGIVFLTFLLPILLTVAYILLSVDAGRNLRAIRRGGANP